LAGIEEVGNVKAANRARCLWLVGVFGAFEGGNIVDGADRVLCHWLVGVFGVFGVFRDSEGSGNVDGATRADHLGVLGGVIIFEGAWQVVAVRPPAGISGGGSHTTPFFSLSSSTIAEEVSQLLARSPRDGSLGCIALTPTSRKVL